MRTAPLLLFVALALSASAEEKISVAELHLKDGRVLEHVEFSGGSDHVALAKWDAGRGTLAYEILPDDIAQRLIAARPVLPARVNPPINYPPLPPQPDYSLPAFELPIMPATKPGADKTEREIAGQCFIVTKGSQNIKLGLVEIRAYREDDLVAMKAIVIPRLTAWLQDAQKVVKRAEADLMNVTAVELLEKMRLTRFTIWDCMPPVAETTKTDADGRFTFKHQLGARIGLFARARRNVGDSTEYYVWLLDMSQITNPSQIFLSNDNLFE